MEDDKYFDERFSKLCGKVEMFVDVMSYLPIHFFCKDIKGAYSGSNQKQLDDLGCTAQEFLGKRPTTVSAFSNNFYGEKICQDIESNDAMVIARSEADSNAALTVDEHVYNRGKKEIYLSKKIAFKNSRGEVVGLVGASMDMTQWVASKKKDYDEEMRVKRMSFLTNFAHDLRTVCQGIIGFSGMLYEEEYNVEKKKKVKCLVDAGNSLHCWIDEMLNLLRLQSIEPMMSKESRFEVGNLRDLIRQLMQLFLPKANQLNISLLEIVDPNVPENLLFDNYLLRRILVHLIDNALKFNCASGKVIIMIDVLEQSEESCRIALKVQDTGIGIAEENQKNIFHEFVKLKSSYESGMSGVGLGLSTVQCLVNELDGHIELNSALGQGTEIIVTMAFNKAKEEEAGCKKTNIIDTIAHLPNDHIQLAQNEELKILLIEDELICQHFATHLLKKYGCRIDIAVTGAQATDLAISNMYDLVFMDIGLPDISGLELIKVFRGMEAYNKKPIVALTAHLDFFRSEAHSAVIKLFNRVLIKPLTVDMMKGILFNSLPKTQ